MPLIHLRDRALIHATGSDATTLLQNVVTADLSMLPDGTLRPCALLTPQGKILYDFLISADGTGGYYIDVSAQDASALMKRLSLYRMRAHVEFSISDQELIAACWDEDSSASRIDSTLLVDSRFPAERRVMRLYAPSLPPETATLADWRSLRIASGVAEGGEDFAAGDAFPHEVLFDRNGGVGLKKGCFIGQEVVSRMQHRGTARKRLVIIEADHPLPNDVQDVMSGVRVIGSLGTTVGKDALAILRLDRAAESIEQGTPLTVGATEIRLRMAPYAGFTLQDFAGSDGGKD